MYFLSVNLKDNLPIYWADSVAFHLFSESKTFIPTQDVTSIPTKSTSLAHKNYSSFFFKLNSKLPFVHQNSLFTCNSYSLLFL